MPSSALYWCVEEKHVWMSHPRDSREFGTPASAKHHHTCGHIQIRVTAVSLCDTLKWIYSPSFCWFSVFHEIQIWMFMLGFTIQLKWGRKWPSSSRNGNKHINVVQFMHYIPSLLQRCWFKYFWNNHYTDIEIDYYSPLVDGCNSVTVSVGHPLEHPPPLSKAQPLKI